MSRSCAQGTVMTELDGPPDPTASTWSAAAPGTTHSEAVEIDHAGVAAGDRR